MNANISRKEQPIVEVTGTMTLRAAVRARNRSPNALVRIADQIDGVGVGALEAFGHGTGNLGVGALQKLASVLFQNAFFNPDLDRLQPANRPESKPAGVMAPPVIDPMSWPTYHGVSSGGPPRHTGAERGVNTAYNGKRAGWSE